MNIFLEERDEDIKAFKKALKLCSGDKNTQKVINKYLFRIKNEHTYSDYLKENFIPLISSKDDFFRAFILPIDDGDYRIEVYIKNSDENSLLEYSSIYNKFCKENEDFFYFQVYDIEKNKAEYEESSEYDKITIKPKKK